MGAELNGGADICGAVEPEIGATYAFNGDSIRVSKTVSGIMTYDTWASLFGLPQVIAGGANKYVWETEQLATIPGGGGTRQYGNGDMR